MKTTIAALVLAAAVASPAMAQEFIESGLPTHIAAPYSAFNTAGANAYASRRPVRHQAQQTPHLNVFSDASVYLQQQNQNDIIDR